MKRDRISEIRQIILREKKVNCENLQKQFNVSIATIRRDLNLLEEEGTIRRTYGGAELVAKDVLDNIEGILPAWHDRKAINLEEKQAIARKVDKMIPEACTIYLDSGTGVYEIARLLFKRKNLTIITNSLRNAALLGMNKNLQVYFIGGNITYDMLITTGMLAREGLNFFPTIDISVLSADGFMKSGGIRDWSMESALLKKAVVDRSKTTYVAMDHSKFEVVATNPICRVSEIDCIITDSKIRHDILEKLMGQVSVVIADMNEE